MRAGLIFIFLLLANLSYSQDRCAAEAPTTGAFEAWLSSQIPSNNLREADPAATVYQIPVVVHLFHKGETVGNGLNLSTERIQAQIDSLTADFRRLNADAANTPAEFLPIAADVEIAFVLARQDPEGNPTNGIVRIKGAQEVYRATFDRLQLRSESFWPPSHYLNIYVMDLQSFIGYASYPRISLPGNLANNSDLQFDGVLVDYEYFGVNESASLFASFGRTLTHEVGHYFGLRHIWGDGGCSVDDFVDDTPLANTDNGNYGSPCTFPNPDDPLVCVPGEPEMFQNYMDYTNDECMNLFTNGQKSRMRTVLLNAPNRLSLISSPGLINPDRFTNDLAITQVLEPREGNCETTTIPIIEITNWGTASVSSYDINFSIDGVPVVPTQTLSTSLEPLDSDTVIFPEVSLSQGQVFSFQIAQVNGTTDENPTNNSISRIIKQAIGETLPFLEDFEGSLQVQGNFSSSNSWQVTNAPKASAMNQAAILNCYENTTIYGEKSIFKTPYFDLSGLPSGEIRFSYAYTHPANAFYDGLQVKVSLDCGETFSQTLWSSLGPSLATATDPGAAFSPANDLEWIDTLVSITDFQNISGVQFAFVGLNGGGNNIYLDNIEVVQTNLLENDASLISADAPIILCEDEAEAIIRIRNIGSADIQSITLRYGPNDEEIRISQLDVPSKDFFQVNLPPVPLLTGNNIFDVVVTAVNDQVDISETGNHLSFQVYQDKSEDAFPFTLDFEQQHAWTILTTGMDSLWEESTINQNELLVAKGFQSAQIGEEDWFVSPVLNTGILDTAGLYFRAAYAARSGFTDRLRVLASINCGETYSYTLLDATSDSLQSANSSSLWGPSGDTDWKEFRIDLSPLIDWQDDIRIAFQFISGGGNNLYIDDIQVRGNELPTYTEVVRMFPNPATFSFNVGLNLPEKETVIIRLIDLSGKLVFQQTVPNALNQIIEIETPGRKGLYLVQVQGEQFSTTQKLYIQR